MRDVRKVLDMTDATNETWPAPRDLAAAFSRTIREWLNARQLAAVRARNLRERDARVCHSHDFCDANMAMLAACESLGFDFMATVETDREKAAHALWNEAWGIARAAGFAEVSAP